jgi:hypothetical protein
MKKMFLALLMLGTSIGVFAQSSPPITSPISDKGMFYADFTPLFFVSGGWGVAVYGDLRCFWLKPSLCGYLNPQLESWG